MQRVYVYRCVHDKQVQKRWFRMFHYHDLHAQFRLVPQTRSIPRTLDPCVHAGSRLLISLLWTRADPCMHGGTPAPSTWPQPCWIHWLSLSA